jgi:hypothetical protein
VQASAQYRGLHARDRVEAHHGTLLAAAPMAIGISIRQGVSP